MISSWQTRNDETVIVGDTVALWVLGHRGAKGVIVRAMDDDSAEVALTACETCPGGVKVRVYEDGLVWLLTQGNGEIPAGLRGGDSPSASRL